MVSGLNWCMDEPSKRCTERSFSIISRAVSGM